MKEKQPLLRAPKSILLAASIVGAMFGSAIAVVLPTIVDLQSRLS
jgi:hypothetical protein